MTRPLIQIDDDEPRPMTDDEYAEWQASTEAPGPYE